VNAIKPRDITTRRDNTAPPATDQNRLVFQLRIVPFLYSGKKGITVNMRQIQAGKLSMPDKPPTVTVRAD